MYRFMVFSGVVLIIIAVCLLIVGIFATESSPISNILTALVCEQYETLDIERTAWSLPNGESGENLNFQCMIEPTQGRDVTDKVILIAIAVFSIPLTLGIIFINIGARKLVKHQTANWQYQLQDNIDILSNMTSGNPLITIQGADKGDLSERLQQLDDAHQKNLITKTEYDRVRQAILDSMDD
ncbi:MAG: hypothetical protein ACPG7F_12210 [Aggregatilineales bacterium]